MEKPPADDHSAWKVYWEAQGQPWRTESEIGKERQLFLNERRVMKRDVEQGIYPFSGIKLTRADVEWLLSTHDNGRGPVYWDDPNHHGREGIDIRGAVLFGENLRALPLSRTLFGLARSEWELASNQQRASEAAHLEKADLQDIHLEGASLRFTHLEGAWLTFAHLEGASLRNAHLEGAFIGRSVLDSTTSLSNIFISDKEHGTLSVGDVTWGNTNLAVVDWSTAKYLGEELIAQMKMIKFDQMTLSKREQYKETTANFRTATRTYRQVSIALKAQGLHEEADHFAYRAHICQRIVFRRQRRLERWLSSALLDLIVGYGYKPARTLILYLLSIIGFALAFMQFGTIGSHHFTLHEGVIFSLTSFHGRGFFPGGLALDAPITTVAAIEAVMGLIIEISLIATFTQRFFGK